MKGGCIEGLDWRKARHIWCKRAVSDPKYSPLLLVSLSFLISFPVCSKGPRLSERVWDMQHSNSKEAIERVVTDSIQMVPIPEGVERDEEEPEDEDYGDAALSDGGELRRARIFAGAGQKNDNVVSRFGNTKLGKEDEDDEIRG